MNHLRIISSTIAPLLLVCSALGQAGDRDVPGQLPNQEIAAARSRYIQTADASGGPAGSDAYPQARRLGARPPLPPRMGYPRAGSPSMWSGGNPKHAAIGAVIGFGLGAALGAKVNTDNHGGAGVKAAVLFGSFGALIGGVAGSAFEPLHHGSGNRRRWPAEDELGSRPKGGRTEETASAKPVISRPSGGSQDSVRSATEAP